MIDELKATPGLSEFYISLQKDFWILRRVFKDKIKADFLNQGLILFEG